eukprot:Amastigsp_a3948_5.p4 type:complete len:117 gc:universal Amastigsp_a3948_5:635-985(+)
MSSSRRQSSRCLGRRRGCSPRPPSRARPAPPAETPKQAQAAAAATTRATSGTEWRARCRRTSAQRPARTRRHGARLPLARPLKSRSRTLTRSQSSCKATSRPKGSCAIPTTTTTTA